MSRYKQSTKDLDARVSFERDVTARTGTVADITAFASLGNVENALEIALTELPVNLFDHIPSRRQKDPPYYFMYWKAQGKLCDTPHAFRKTKDMHTFKLLQYLLQNAGRSIDPIDIPLEIISGTGKARIKRIRESAISLNEMFNHLGLDSIIMMDYYDGLNFLGVGTAKPSHTPVESIHIDNTAYSLVFYQDKKTIDITKNGAIIKKIHFPQSIDYDILRAVTNSPSRISLEELASNLGVDLEKERDYLMDRIHKICRYLPVQVQIKTFYERRETTKNLGVSSIGLLILDESVSEHRPQTYIGNLRETDYSSLRQSIIKRYGVSEIEINRYAVVNREKETFEFALIQSPILLTDRKGRRRTEKYNYLFWQKEGILCSKPLAFRNEEDLSFKVLNYLMERSGSLIPIGDLPEDIIPKLLDENSRRKKVKGIMEGLTRKMRTAGLYTAGKCPYLYYGELWGDHYIGFGVKNPADEIEKTLFLEDYNLRVSFYKDHRTVEFAVSNAKPSKIYFYNELQFNLIERIFSSTEPYSIDQLCSDLESCEVTLVDREKIMQEAEVIRALLPPGIKIESVFADNSSKRFFGRGFAVNATKSIRIFHPFSLKEYQMASVQDMPNFVVQVDEGFETGLLGTYILDRTKGILYHRPKDQTTEITVARFRDYKNNLQYKLIEYLMSQDKNGSMCLFGNVVPTQLFHDKFFASDSYSKSYEQHFWPSLFKKLGKYSKLLSSSSQPKASALQFSVETQKSHPVDEEQLYQYLSTKCNLPEPVCEWLVKEDLFGLFSAKTDSYNYSPIFVTDKEGNKLVLKLFRRAEYGEWEQLLNYEMARFPLLSGRVAGSSLKVPYKIGEYVIGCQNSMLDVIAVSKTPSLEQQLDNFIRVALFGLENPDIVERAPSVTPMNHDEILDSMRIPSSDKAMLQRMLSDANYHLQRGSHLIVTGNAQIANNPGPLLDLERVRSCDNYAPSLASLFICYNVADSNIQTYVKYFCEELRKRSGGLIAQNARELTFETRDLMVSYAFKEVWAWTNRSASVAIRKPNELYKAGDSHESAFYSEYAQRMGLAQEKIIQQMAFTYGIPLC
ncbi:MAG: hypothetical protein V1859_05575 [archaeon]